jgi:hypothetical protein
MGRGVATETKRKSIMRKIGKAMLATAIPLVALGSATVAAHASTSNWQARDVTTEHVRSGNPADTSHGCPSGYACMYTEQGYANNQPKHEYYKYGCYNLKDEEGFEYIFNNQVGSATVTVYLKYGCSDPGAPPIPAGETKGGEMEAINSLSLQP